MEVAVPSGRGRWVDSELADHREYDWEGGCGVWDEGDVEYWGSVDDFVDGFDVVRCLMFVTVDAVEVLSRIGGFGHC